MDEINNTKTLQDAQQSAMKWFESYVKEQSNNSKLEAKLKTAQDEIKQLNQIIEDLSIKLLKNEIKDVIKSHNPKDFDDVWAAVINELKHSQNQSLDEVVEKIKRYNPRLFYSYDR